VGCMGCLGQKDGVEVEKQRRWWAAEVNVNSVGDDTGRSRENRILAEISVTDLRSLFPAAGGATGPATTDVRRVLVELELRHGDDKRVVARFEQGVRRCSSLPLHTDSMATQLKGARRPCPADGEQFLQSQ
jgi:hypothetical protein